MDAETAWYCNLGIATRLETPGQHPSIQPSRWRRQMRFNKAIVDLKPSCQGLSTDSPGNRENGPQRWA